MRMNFSKECKARTVISAECSVLTTLVNVNVQVWERTFDQEDDLLTFGIPSNIDVSSDTIRF